MASPDSHRRRLAQLKSSETKARRTQGDREADAGKLRRDATKKRESANKVSSATTQRSRLREAERLERRAEATDKKTAAADRVAPLRGGGWRTLSRPELGLADVISNRISASSRIQEGCLRSLRSGASLLMFSDYGGAHKHARYEVLSFLVSTVHGLHSFDTERRRLREGSLGVERRMSYKALNDKVRMRSLRAYLDATDQLQGLLVNFALDKRATDRLSEGYTSDTAFGHLGRWADRPFGKLTRVGHLAAILIEGVRRDGQNLIWITDEDEIAPNDPKHAEATKILGHYLNSYCSGAMGHFRFGTTASDAGDLLIEDLAAAPDLAAGCLGEVLSLIAPHPESSSVERLFLPAGGGIPAKVIDIATWLADSSRTLKKLNLVVDGSSVDCSIRNFEIITKLEEL